MVSCNKSDNFEQSVLPADSGAVRLSITAPKSVESEAYNAMDNCAVRVYKYTDTTDENGEATRVKELIRLYKSVEALPSKLELLAGDYAVRVDAGTKAAASFTELSYHGESDFTVEAGIITPVKVDCKMLNSLVEVVFDPSVAKKLDVNSFADVCIGEEYDAAGVKEGKVSYLRYEQDGTGYFLMPEDATTLTWFFHGESSNTEIGTVEKSGKIENVAAATKYTLTFKYSKGLGGSLSFEVDVDTTEEIFNDKIAFSPDPTIKGIGFDPEQVQYVVSDNFTFNIAALANINQLTVTAEGTTYDILNGENNGINIVKNSAKNCDVTISPEFFATMNGGEHNLAFRVEDADGGQANVVVVFTTQGIISIDDVYDPWFNSANFQGVVLDSAATNVAIKYRTVGGEWNSLETTKSTEANIYSAYLEFGQGQSYEYALFVNDVLVGNTLSISTPVGVQIPNSDMESWAMDGKTWCPTADLKNALWDTGNGAISSYSSLIGQDNITYPKDETRPGSTGTKCAYMQSINAVIALAAGNLFIGDFIKTDGTGGVLDFGKPFNFTIRPKAVKLWMKSKCGTINKGDKASGPDLTKIFLCLCDRTEPYHINTNNKETLFDPRTSPNVVASAIYESTTSVTEWTEITIPIEYKDNTKPNYIVFTLTCSGYGDYFTGSTESEMYIDDIELVY